MRVLRHMKFQRRMTSELSPLGLLLCASLACALVLMFLVTR